MHKLWKALFVFVLAILILACDIGSSVPTTMPDQQSVATIVAGTLQAITAAAPTKPAQATSTAKPAMQGVSVSYNKVGFIIPTGLANGTMNDITTDVELPYTNPSSGDMAQHTKITLDGYILQGTLLQPQIMVFKSGEYAQYGDMTQQIISTLQNLQYSQGQPLPQGLPVGHLRFSPQIQTLNFANGHGIRYLTQYDQAPLPINNHEIFYYYQGLTNDGQYYVQAILPLNTSFLAPDESQNSPLPPNGIPFPLPVTADQFQSYLDTVTQKLNATSPDQFTPSLSMLDSLIQSITITP